MPRDVDEIVDEIMETYDAEVEDLAIGDAIDLAEALVSAFEGRLNGLRDDQRRAAPVIT